MTSQRLTNRAQIAKTTPMWGHHEARRGGVNKAGRIAPVLIALAATNVGGCVSVNAPDKPIVIELNINIKQAVIYRLAADAGNTIDQNQDIF